MAHDIEERESKKNIDDTNEIDPIDYSCYCKNCFRKQNQCLVSTYGEEYTLHFTERSKWEHRKFNKFKYAPRDNFNDTFSVCQECDAFLVSEENRTKAKSAEYI